MSGRTGRVPRTPTPEREPAARRDLSRPERAILAHVILPDDPVVAADALEELGALAASAGAEVVATLHQNRRVPDKTTFLGSGRVEELADLCRTHAATLVAFGADLSPAQGVNLERRLGVRVLDRSQLIMDLFAVRARTHQARLQVELAQLQYSLPRLKRLWSHLDRYKGGIGMRGPGETQLELDRREIEKKITDRRRRLREIELRNEVQRAQRGGRFTVGLIGYTNAGKSTLFNRLTRSEVPAEDRPFTTLDTKTSPWKVARGCTVLVSDTIGFVRNLPHHLISSFHATLEETLHADLLLHVVDATREDALLLVDSVDEVLAATGAAERPRRLVANKIDGVGDRALLARFGANALHVSARTGAGIDELAAHVATAARAAHELLQLSVPLAQGALIAAITAEGQVLASRYDEGRWIVEARLSPALAGRAARFAAKP